LKGDVLCVLRALIFIRNDNIKIAELLVIIKDDLGILISVERMIVYGVEYIGESERVSY
jgi:hypothetical protein